MDNILCIQKDTNKYLKLVDIYFQPKDTPECLTTYLREYISKFVITNDGNGVTFWAMSEDIHVKKALKVVEAKMKEDSVRWKPSNKISDHSLSSQYYLPELEMTK